MRMDSDQQSLGNRFAEIVAVILAAGQSRRMGRPKMALPWGATTVIGQVLSTLSQAGLQNMVVVTGGDRALVEQAIAGSPASSVFNPRYGEDNMIYSLQAGLPALEPYVQAALVVLGDQPQIETRVVEALIELYFSSLAPLIVPSYQMHRGHPWLVRRSLWPALMTLQAPQTLRDFLHAHSVDTFFMNVDTPSVLHDLDTPDDYNRQRPAGGRS